MEKKGKIWRSSRESFIQTALKKRKVKESKVDLKWRWIKIIIITCLHSQHVTERDRWENEMGRILLDRMEIEKGKDYGMDTGWILSGRMDIEREWAFAATAVEPGQ